MGNHLSSLDHNGASAAPTVADAGGTEARAVLLEHGEQRDDYARAAAADGVADGDGAPVDVDLCLVEAEQLVVGEGDDREGLVDLEVVDLVRVRVRVRVRVSVRVRVRVLRLLRLCSKWLYFSAFSALMGYGKLHSE